MRKSLHQDQRGLGHVVTIAVAVLVIAAIGAVGYKVSQNKKDNTSGSSSSSSTKVVADSAAVDACNKVYHDKDLCKFTGNYAIDNLSFKMTLTATASDGTTNSTYLSDGKGNSSMSGTSNGQATDIIVLDKVSYMKDNSDGTWIKFPANDTSAPKDNPTSDVKFDTATDTAAKSTLTYKKLGKEACGKLTCFKYQMIDSTQPSATNFFWFDTKDYRMQHWYNKDANGTTDMVISYQSVKITAPSPTKDFSAATGIDPSLYTSATSSN